MTVRDSQIIYDNGPGPARRRSAPVMSWIAMAITAGFLVAFLVQLGVFESSEPPAPKASRSLPKNDQVVVSSSTITGFDREQQPFRLDSQSAQQDPVNANIIYMKGVKGELQKADGSGFIMTARDAVYDTNGKMIDLSGSVKIVSKDRFVAKMPRARVTLRDKRLYTKAPVEVTFPAGTITANGVQVTEDGQNILFFDRVKAVLRGTSGKGERQ